MEHVSLFFSLRFHQGSTKTVGWAHNLSTWLQMVFRLGRLAYFRKGCAELKHRN